MENLARYLMVGGVVLFLVGGGLFLAAKWGVPLGRLRGDIRIESENGSFHFPILTSIIISLILTVVLNLVARWFNR